MKQETLHVIIIAVAIIIAGVLNALILRDTGKARFFGPALSQFNKAIFLSNSGG